jgi:hypothetical protein
MRYFRNLSMEKRKSILIATIIGMTFPATTFATPITINFTGQISSIGIDLQGGGVNIGDTINGHFTYETIGNNDSWGWTDDYGVYQVSSFEVSFGSSFQVSSNGVRDTLKTQDDMQNGSATKPADALTVRSGRDNLGDITSDLLNGYHAFNFQVGLRLENEIDQLWDDDFLPDLNDWETIRQADLGAPDWGWMNFTDTGSKIRFSTEYSVAVPEPSVIALFATGLFGIGFARRRQS